MLHALTSLYREGLIASNSPFAVYPSSAPGQLSPVLEEFVRPASRLFHGYFREDLLVRAAQAPDTSMARVKAWSTGQAANIDFTTQANTVHVNEARRNLIAGRTVIVFDDFTTTGMSLEWARNLLYEAGATRVVLITIGKYGQSHIAHLPVRNDIVKPFARKGYTLDMFKKVSIPMTHSLAAQQRTRRSFELWKNGKPYPTEH
jgi:hypothetical protein